nr:MAG TPA: hypothetical protein [Caudoviricetes sp.]
MLVTLFVIPDNPIIQRRKCYFSPRFSSPFPPAVLRHVQYLLTP